MISTTDSHTIDSIKLILLKPFNVRSYDDILLLKSYLSKTEYIRHNLSTVSSIQLDELCRNINLETCELDENVFKQGDVGDKLYIILSGRCDIKVTYKVELISGESELRDKLIVTLSNGQHFGERALVFDEPRAATVTCSHHTDLLCISKATYLSVLNQYDEALTNQNKLSMNKDSKDYVVRVLTKARHKRSAEEIEGISSYLGRRIAFFEKLDNSQRLEVCRVAEILPVWGKSVLFKQGSMGQAFYIILTGSVDIYVSNNSRDGHREERSKEGGPALVRGIGEVSIYDGLGDKVSTLHSGESFGERALENESSQRMASVVTYDDLTELVVLAKEDYHNLVSVMLKKDSMDKILLLRKTSFFHHTDVSHLMHMAKCMEPKRFHLDEVLYECGREAMGIIIIACGECKAVIEADSNPTPNPVTNTVRAVNTVSGTNSLSLTNTVSDTGVGTKTASMAAFINKMRGKQTVNLGRIAPYSVLGTCIALQSDLSDTVYNTETVMAASLVSCYVINKVDFFTSIPKDTVHHIIQTIKAFKMPIMRELWETTPKAVDENDWKINKAWGDFRDDILQKKSHPSLIQNFRNMNELQLTFETDGGVDLACDSASDTCSVNSRGSKGNTNGNNKITYSAVGLALVAAGKKSKIRKLHAGIGMGGHGKGLSLIAAYSRNSSNSILSHGSVNSINNNSASTSTVSIDWGSREVLDKERKHRQPKGRNLYLETWKKSRRSTVISNNISSLDSLAFEDDKDVLTTIERGLARQRETKYLKPLNSDSPSSPSSAPRQSVFPFFLLQIHCAKYTGRDGVMGGAIQRFCNCYLRLCGTMPTCADAKHIADEVMKNAFLTIFKSRLDKENELSLNWRPFNGFEGLPMQCTDHFIIYCRDSAIEFASLNPSENLLDQEFPAIAKLRNQRYACVNTNQLHPNFSRDDESPKTAEEQEESDDEEKSLDSEDTKFTKSVADRSNRNNNNLTKSSPNNKFEKNKKLKLSAKITEKNKIESERSVSSFQNKNSIFMEMSIVNEILFVCSSHVECLRYSILQLQLQIPENSRNLKSSDSNKSLSNFNANENSLSNKRICVFPLFDWFAANEESLRNFYSENALARMSEDGGVDIDIDTENSSKKINSQTNKKSTENSSFMLEAMKSLKTSLHESFLPTDRQTFEMRCKLASTIELPEDMGVSIIPASSRRINDSSNNNINSNRISSTKLSINPTALASIRRQTSSNVSTIKSMQMLGREIECKRLNKQVSGEIEKIELLSHCINDGSNDNIAFNNLIEGSSTLNTEDESQENANVNGVNAKAAAYDFSMYRAKLDALNKGSIGRKKLIHLSNQLSKNEIALSKILNNKKEMNTTSANVMNMNSVGILGTAPPSKAMVTIDDDSSSVTSLNSTTGASLGMYEDEGQGQGNGILMSEENIKALNEITKGRTLDDSVKEDIKMGMGLVEKRLAMFDALSKLHVPVVDHNSPGIAKDLHRKTHLSNGHRNTLTSGAGINASLPAESLERKLNTLEGMLRANQTK